MLLWPIKSAKAWIQPMASQCKSREPMRPLPYDRRAALLSLFRARSAIAEIMAVLKMELRLLYLGAASKIYLR